MTMQAPPVASSDTIKVSIRVRPLNKRELEAGSEHSVSIDGPIVRVQTDDYPQDFPFQIHGGWSCNENDENYSSQEKVMEYVGEPIIQNALKGYNGCMFAYGQTGSGKSYTMMGTRENNGLIMRSIQSLFEEKDRLDDPSLQVWLSYVEIYNEQVRDLLHPGHATMRELKIIDHPLLGVIMPHCIISPCEDASEVFKLIEFGTKQLAVASTNMNTRSSRSHTIMILKLRNIRNREAGDKNKTSSYDGVVPSPRVSTSTSGREQDENVSSRMKNGRRQRTTSVMTAATVPRASMSKVYFIDLAGSERNSRSITSQNAFGREGRSINQSLFALNLIVQSLSESNHDDQRQYLPFQTSKLTFLLRDSLSGNSLTHMIATISPAREHKRETLATLEFASKVKKIKIASAARINVDNRDECLVFLVAEAKKLRSHLHRALSSSSSSSIELVSVFGDIEEELRARENVLQNMRKSFEQHVENKKANDLLRAEALHRLGFTLKSLEDVHAQSIPYLINISEDESLSNKLIFQLPEGLTTIGRASKNQVILNGLGISNVMCAFQNSNNFVVQLTFTDPESPTSDQGGSITNESRVLVNGERLISDRELCNFDTIALGRACVFRLCIPNLQPKVPTREEIRGVEELPQYSYDDSESFSELRLYLDDLKQRFSEKENAEVLREKLKEYACEVDEANEISNEIRPHDRIRFEVELVWDIYREPDDVIVFRVMNFLEDKPSVLYYWGVNKFRERLEGMREKYDEFQRTGSFVGIDDPALDPWLEPTMTDVQHASYTRMHGALMKESMREEIIRCMDSSNVSESGGGAGVVASQPATSRSERGRLSNKDKVISPGTTNPAQKGRNTTICAFGRGTSTAANVNPLFSNAANDGRPHSSREANANSISTPVLKSAVALNGIHSPKPRLSNRISRKSELLLQKEVQTHKAIVDVLRIQLLDKETKETVLKNKIQELEQDLQELGEEATRREEAAGEALNHLTRVSEKTDLHEMPMPVSSSRDMIRPAGANGNVLVPAPNGSLVATSGEIQQSMAQLKDKFTDACKQEAQFWIPELRMNPISARKTSPFMQFRLKKPLQYHNCGSASQTPLPFNNRPNPNPHISGPTAGASVVPYNGNSSGYPSPPPCSPNWQEQQPFPPQQASAAQLNSAPCGGGIQTYTNAAPASPHTAAAASKGAGNLSNGNLGMQPGQANVIANIPMTTTNGHSQANVECTTTNNCNMNMNTCMNPHASNGLLNGTPGIPHRGMFAHNKSNGLLQQVSGTTPDTPKRQCLSSPNTVIRASLSAVAVPPLSQCVGWKRPAFSITT